MMPDLKMLLLNLHQRPIAFYPLYADLMGSIAGGVVLSQLLYWWSQMGGNDFYKTDAEIIDETHVTVSELRAAKKRLKQLDFIAVKARGVPPVTWYIIDFRQFIETLNSFKLNWGISRKRTSEIHENDLGNFTKSLYESETTSEITSERKTQERAREEFGEIMQADPKAKPRSFSQFRYVPPDEEDAENSPTSGRDGAGCDDAGGGGDIAELIAASSVAEATGLPVSDVASRLSPPQTPDCANYPDPTFPCSHETNALIVLSDVFGETAPRKQSHRHLHTFVHRHSLVDVVQVATRYTETTPARTQWKLGFIFAPDNAETLLAAVQHPPPAAPAKPERPEDTPLRYAAYKEFPPAEKEWRDKVNAQEPREATQEPNTSETMDHMSKEERDTLLGPLTATFNMNQHKHEAAKHGQAEIAAYLRQQREGE